MTESLSMPTVLFTKVNAISDNFKVRHCCVSSGQFFDQSGLAVQFSGQPDPVSFLAGMQRVGGHTGRH